MDPRGAPDALSTSVKEVPSSPCLASKMTALSTICSRTLRAITAITTIFRRLTDSDPRLARSGSQPDRATANATTRTKAGQSPAGHQGPRVRGWGSEQQPEQPDAAVGRGLGGRDHGGDRVGGPDGGDH